MHYFFLPNKFNLLFFKNIYIFLLKENKQTGSDLKNMIIKTNK